MSKPLFVSLTDQQREHLRQLTRNLPAPATPPLVSRRAPASCSWPIEARESGAPINISPMRFVSAALPSAPSALALFKKGCKRLCMRSPTWATSQDYRQGRSAVGAAGLFGTARRASQMDDANAKQPVEVMVQISSERPAGRAPSVATRRPRRASNRPTQRNCAASFHGA